MSRIPLLALWTLGVLVVSQKPAFGQGGPPASALDEAAARLHVTPADVPVRALSASRAFLGLTDKEKWYAYWMSQAAWRGAPIVCAQVSPESPLLFEFLLRVYSVHPQALRIEANRAGISDGELSQLDDYAARFFSNLGNYLEFGDTKFVPALPVERLEAIVSIAARLQGQGSQSAMLGMFGALKQKIYSLDPKERLLAMPGEGVTGYYGPDVTSDDVAFVGRYLESKKIEAWNTRITMQPAGKDPGAPKIVKIQIASVNRSEVRDTFEGRPVLIGYGDHSEILKGVVDALVHAKEFAANDLERQMIDRYIAHFQEGHIDLHKDAMRFWVKDVGPSVETNLGFIETYRDPAKVRAEWEGLVAVVDREQSAVLGKLVDAAPALIPLLPWSKEFEKDAFQRPDFTSLEVVAFANAGIPAGINIPNYDDIRMTLGFKNVSLGNVLAAGAGSNERVEFIRDDDQELFRKYRKEAFDVQVGLHELLGHGSGKLLSEESPGKFNFDRSVVNPLTNAPVATWYQPGQTWNSVFGKISTSYEECRAEAVGLYLCTHPDVMRVFGHTGQEASDIAYINWLLMARAGLDALSYYDAKSNTFGQSHMQARYVLLSVMLKAGGGLLTIEQDSQGRYVANLDRSKIESIGRPAIGEFLKKLGIYKAIADAAAGQALYKEHSEVGAAALAIREFALKVKKPRHIWVQPVLDASPGGVVLREYPATDRGVIDSFVDRFGALGRGR